MTNVHAQISIKPVKDSGQSDYIEPFYVEARGGQIKFEMPTRTIVFQLDDLKWVIELAEKAREI